MIFINLGRITKHFRLKNRQIKKFVFASTWHVIRSAQYEPVDEAHPCNPEYPFDISKYAAELLVLSYDKFFNIPSIILRIGSAYGPNMAEDTVIVSLIDSALNERPLIIEGNGNQIRHFTHVKDVADAFICALKSDLRGKVYFITYNHPTTINELAQKIESDPKKIIHVAPEYGDIKAYAISNDLAKRELGWFPRIGLEEGIEEYKKWYLKERKVS